MYLITNKVVNSKSVYNTAFHMYWCTPLFLSRETDLLLWNLISYQSDSKSFYERDKCFTAFFRKIASSRGAYSIFSPFDC